MNVEDIKVATKTMTASTNLVINLEKLFDLIIPSDKIIFTSLGNLFKGIKTSKKNNTTFLY